MNEALKIAIEHGYKPLYKNYGEPIDYVVLFKKGPAEWRGFECEAVYGKLAILQAITSPLFWQAIIRSKGIVAGMEKGYLKEDYIKRLAVLKGVKYMEILLTGGSTEQFWKELLKK